MSDNVFRREFKWSTYQDKQLDTLMKIEKSFSASLTNSRLVSTNMQKVEVALTAIARDLLGAEKLKRFNSEIEKIDKAANNLGDSIDNTNKKLTKFSNDLSTAGTKFLSTMQDAGKEILNYLGGLKGIGDQANNYSKLSNSLIQISGMSGATVKDFRAEFMSMINDLNKDTGMAYNAQDSYRQLVTIAGATTGNLDAIKEMSRPLLLAQESLNGGIESLSNIFARFYTRYAFSSMDMQAIVDDIRVNTTGNSATAEATAKNISLLESELVLAAKGDKDKISEYLEEVSGLTSFFESLQLDSGPYAEIINKVFSDQAKDDTSLVILLSKLGFTPESLRLYAEDNGIDIAGRELLRATSKLGQWISDSDMSYQVAESMLQDYELLMQAATTTQIKTVDELWQEYVDNQKYAAGSAAEVVEDKYYSMAEKTNNWLENIYELLARGQEYLGFGLSDIAILASILRLGSGGKGGTGSTGRSNILGSLSSTRTGANQYGPWTKTTAGTGLLGLLETGGANLSGGALGGKSAALYGGVGAAGVAAGVGMGVYGISQGIKDIKDDDKGHGIANIAGGAAGIVGAGALSAGLLGVGATNIWNPVGWVALAAGAVTLLATSIHKAVKTIGAADAVEAAYEDAKKSILKQASAQEDVLSRIKFGLEDNEDLEKMRSDLINSGILSEHDLSVAREANRMGLERLTEAYLKVTDQWSDEATSMLDKYKMNDKEYARVLHGDLETKLQELNDSGKLTGDNEESTAVERLLYNLYNSLGERVAGGEELDKKTQKLYKAMQKGFDDDGRLTSKKEFNRIIDAGAWNTVFQNSNLSVEQLMTAISSMAGANDTGRLIYQSIMPNNLTYYGIEEVARVADIVARVKSATSKEQAIVLLDQLAAAGITSSKYIEIGEAAAQWNLTGYAAGSNYISSNQIALLHEGEAVTPKKYNPAANMNELEVLREQYRNTTEESSKGASESQQYLRELIEGLNNIKEFLSYWREDNIKRETITENRNKYATSTRLVANYLLGR